VFQIPIGWLQPKREKLRFAVAYCACRRLSRSRARRRAHRIPGRQSGREVVDLMQSLARKQGVTVLLVTHDNRILDIADRIVHLEDGRLSTFTEHVTANTQHMMDMLARNNRKGDLRRRVAEAPAADLPALLEQATHGAEEFLRVTELSQDDAFQSMFEEVLAAFTRRFGEEAGAERASVFLVDRARSELWLKLAQEEGGKPVDVRMPLDRGIAVFAVAQLLNKRGGAPFDASDEARFQAFARGLAPILEAWARMGIRNASR
jgi:hypothetical protein